MNLYIEIDENGNAKNHPAFENNLIEVFGFIPNNWKPFIRVEKPIKNIYQLFDNEEPIYQKINDVWTDVWLLRDMTDEEKLAKQQTQKDIWNSLPNRENFATWIFDENSCSYKSPIPEPKNDKIYRWDGQVNTWIEVF